MAPIWDAQNSLLCPAMPCLAHARDALAETGHELEAKVAALEAQATQLEDQQRLLEEARGELGSSRSQMQIIERELQVGGWVGGVWGLGAGGMLDCRQTLIARLDRADSLGNTKTNSRCCRPPGAT